jgi:transposase
VPNSSGTTLGVDTHADVHVAVALDQLGRRLGTLAIPSTPAGYASLETWATGLDTVEQVGLEGTGCYGAGLSRWLRQHGHRVVEVNRPDRQTRRRRGIRCRRCRSRRTGSAGRDRDSDPEVR